MCVDIGVLITMYVPEQSFGGPLRKIARVSGIMFSHLFVFVLQRLLFIEDAMRRVIAAPPLKKHILLREA